MATITKHDELTAAIIGGIRAADAESQAARCSEVHVSDLLLCMRQSYLDKLHRPELPDSKVLMFVAGKGHHDRLEAGLHDNTMPDLKADESGDTVITRAADGEVSMKWKGIIGTVDAMWNGLPVEIKTNYIYYAAAQPSTSYIKQLKSYCVLLGVNAGYIVVFYVNHHNEAKRREPLMKSYHVTFTARELDNHRKVLLANNATFNAAVGLKIPPPMVARGDKWLCDYCSHRPAGRCDGL